MANNTDKHNEKLEHQNKKLKKKNRRSGKIILILLLIILILAAVIFLFDPLGFGNGMGILNNGGSGSGSAAPAQTEQQTSEEAAVTAPPAEEPTVTNIGVTISGATYIYNGSESSVADIIAAATAAEGEVIVKITDDSATANAMDALTAELDKNTIPYIIE